MAKRGKIAKNVKVIYDPWAITDLEHLELWYKLIKETQKKNRQ